MTEFKTSQEKQLDGIVAALSDLYQGQPVASVRIGRSCGMGHHQTLIYLHTAREAGRATPVFSNAAGSYEVGFPAMFR